MIWCPLLVLHRTDFDCLSGSAKDLLKRRAEHSTTIVKEIQNKHL